MTDEPREDEEIQELLDEFYSKAEQRDWWKLPHPLLNYRAAEDCSRREVLQILSQLADGAFI